MAASKEEALPLCKNLFGASDVLTQVQRVSMRSVGERGALVHLVQQLLFHLCDGVTVQHFGRQGLGLVHSSPLHQNI